MIPKNSRPYYKEVDTVGQSPQQRWKKWPEKKHKPEPVLDIDSPNIIGNYAMLVATIDGVLCIIGLKRYVKDPKTNKTMVIIQLPGGHKETCDKTNAHNLQRELTEEIGIHSLVIPQINMCASVHMLVKGEHRVVWIVPVDYKKTVYNYDEHNISITEPDEEKESFDIVFIPMQLIIDSDLTNVNAKIVTTEGTLSSRSSIMIKKALTGL
jgi:hypothetical protein